MTKKSTYNPLPGDIVSINEDYEFPKWRNKVGTVLAYHKYHPDVAEIRGHKGYFTLKAEKSGTPLCVYKHEINLIERPETGEENGKD